MKESSRVVSVLGGYGIFGGRIAEALSLGDGCHVRVVGRNVKIGGNFASRIGADFHPCSLDDRDSLRRVYNCDAPELELFPSAFCAQTVRFSAGLELNVLNHLLSVCALPCRWFGLNLMRRARLFLNLSLMLFPFGTRNGALAVWVRGRAPTGELIGRRIAVVTDYDGPATPSSAAIVLTRKLLASAPVSTGAFPCVGFLTLDELMAHLRPLGIWCVRGDETGWQEPLRKDGCSTSISQR